MASFQVAVTGNTADDTTTPLNASIPEANMSNAILSDDAASCPIMNPMGTRVALVSDFSGPFLFISMGAIASHKPGRNCE